MFSIIAIFVILDFILIWFWITIRQACDYARKRSTGPPLFDTGDNYPRGHVPRRLWYNTQVINTFFGLITIFIVILMYNIGSYKNKNV